MKGHLNIKPQIRTIISNALSLSLLQWVNYLLPLFLVPYLVRSLGTDKFGLVMFAQSLATIFTIISDCGFSISGTRQLSIINGVDPKNTNEQKTIIKIFIKIKLYFLYFGLKKFVNISTPI